MPLLQLHKSVVDESGFIQSQVKAKLGFIGHSMTTHLHILFFRKQSNIAKKQTNLVDLLSLEKKT